MNDPQWTCAFLSTDNVRADVVDDHYALEPLARLGVAVESHAWRALDVDWSAFDLVIVRSTWDYHLDADGFFAALEQIESAGTRIANPRPVMHWNQRKNYLADLRAGGVPIVDSVFGDGLDESLLEKLARRFNDVEWIIKPQISASAHGVIRLSGAPDNATREHMLEAFANRAFLAQPFVEDVVKSGEYSVFYFDGRYSHCILKTPCEGDFRVQEEYGSHIRAVNPSADLRRAAERVREQIPEACLYERIDMVRDASGAFVVMEVELIEPSLYLRTDPDAGERFAHAVVSWLEKN